MNIFFVRKVRVGAFMILMICEVCVCVDAGRWDEEGVGGGLLYNCALRIRT